jgi:hypothetical protein
LLLLAVVEKSRSKENKPALVIIRIDPIAAKSGSFGVGLRAIFAQGNHPQNNGLGGRMTVAVGI